MATDKTLGLEHGDLARITKLTKLHRLGPEGKGFSYTYIKECLDELNERSNDDITAIAKGLVAARKASMALVKLKPRTRRNK